MDIKALNQGKIGFRIYGDIKRSDRDILERLKNVGTCAISDGLNKFNTMHHAIKPVYEEVKIAGNAITVRMRPGDNLMLHKAIGMAQAGDVIVVDTCGCESNSVLGDLMATAAVKKGIAGIVIDGGVRDVLELKRSKAPIFAKCVTPAVGDKGGPGEINAPISCGGVPVNPGDIIVGDANGIVVIDPSIIDEVLKGAEAKLEKDNKRMEEILRGVITKPDIDEALRKAGVIG
ncbi:RraA family protein [Geosporobacter ferrireducens]|uniref:Putative 4-hydroxy-4-methyl-2-oxoglutarate aldolase n=1 Tax=Geosporobacter ferrireducens TaxID=1424294 RepID=A0A1D8GIC6_9FIRM|nr:hypothetical protein [Geosporobacter ferrireducens]AOT70656.1 hypothetical protein Gferi_14390 [Geosporobacter ferrireducens]